MLKYLSICTVDIANTIENAKAPNIQTGLLVKAAIMAGTTIVASHALINIGAVAFFLITFFNKKSMPFFNWTGLIYVIYCMNMIVFYQTEFGQD